MGAAVVIQPSRIVGYHLQGSPQPLDLSLQAGNFLLVCFAM
jgi:hypothetical protein